MPTIILEFAGDDPVDSYELAEQKLVYRVLHKQVKNYPDLFEGRFLIDLQKTLQQQAQRDGVDIADHSAWEDWLSSS
jgi:deoxyadenosine/deoxycytidine kinase